MITGIGTIVNAAAILDAMISMVFDSTLGIGVLFAAIPLFIYQGAITLLGSMIAPFLTDALITQII